MPEGALSASSRLPTFVDDDRAAFRAQLLQVRRAETTRKSAALLLSLAKIRPTAGPDLAPATPLLGAANTSGPTGVASKRTPPASQSEIRSPKSEIDIESLLAQLAPHLETIASELGIDPDMTEEAPSRPENIQSRYPHHAIL